jgi:hypothetical protein
MSIRQAKEKIAQAQRDEPNNKRLHRQLKQALKKKRAASDAPQFPGSHRGY